VAAKNSLKIYRENTFYHLYNRGVEKRNIFEDLQDISVFLSYLKTYLSPKEKINLSEILANPNVSYKEKEIARRDYFLKNYSEKVNLLAYALMPNHFHLLIRQKILSMDCFMNSLCSRYAIYFNRKYKRVGPLFQGVYKAVLVESEEQLLHLSRYIHLNQSGFNGISFSYPNSLPEYLGEKNTSWINHQLIINYFSKNNPNLSYQNFMGQGHDNSFIDKVSLD